MSFANHPQVKKLLEKATLESLIKIYFQRVYSRDEIQEMENALKNALDKYSEKEILYDELIENNKNEAESLLNECLDTLCEKTLDRGKNHTPKTLLVLAKLFMKIGDLRLACEIIWCSASLAIQEFITDRGLNIRLYSHNGKTRFARALSKEIGHQFAVFETCHSSFYTNSKGARDVTDAFKDAHEFVQQLQMFKLTNEKKNELEKDNFNH